MHVTCDIGTTFRPARIKEALDEAHTRELKEQEVWIRRVKNAGVFCVREGIGHIPLHKVEQFSNIIDHNRIEAVNAYYSRMNDIESIRARRTLRTLPKNYQLAELTDEQKDHFSHIVILYQQAGLLVKKHQLPTWVFDQSSGYKVMNFYDKLKPYILERRRGEPTYALHFEWLYIKLKKKNPSWESPDQTV